MCPLCSAVTKSVCKCISKKGLFFSEQRQTASRSSSFATHRTQAVWVLEVVAADAQGRPRRAVCALCGLGGQPVQRDSRQSEQTTVMQHSVGILLNITILFSTSRGQAVCLSMKSRFRRMEADRDRHLSRRCSPESDAVWEVIHQRESGKQTFPPPRPCM